MVSTGSATRAASARVGRPRRSAQQSAEVRARVIDVARRLFAGEGFAAVSMRRIAAEAGCAPMTLYGYFHSKNEILRYIWEGFFEELFGRVAAATARGSAAQRLRDGCRAYLQYWLDHPERYCMIYLNQDQAAEGERYYVDASPIVERYGNFRELIAAAQADGDAWPGDAQVMGEALICGMHGIAHSLVTIPEYRWAPARALLDALLRIVLRSSE